MLMDHVEKLKLQYTDKYVAVDASRPELRRFEGLTGYVKTVNMSGRALVEFASYANNIGWYDIDIDFLTLVDKPKEEEIAPAKKAPAKSKAKAKKPAAPSGKASAPTSVADVLAAARSGGGKTAAPKKIAPAAAPKSAAAMSVADVLAAARGEGASGKTAAPKKATTTAAPKSAAAMSVADVLAAARGEGASGKAASETPSGESSESIAQLLENARQPRASADKAPEASKPKAMSTADILAAARGGAAAAPEPAAEAEPSDPEPEVAAQPVPAGDIPTDTEGILAWCREHDGN